MNFELLPIEETIQVLRTEQNPKKAFTKIIGFANEKFPSDIWNEYCKMNLKRDIDEATIWIQDTLSVFPSSKGIYFGLDTLNMNHGTRTNIEIGRSKSCNPHELSDDWSYECESYGDSHLIKGLFEVSDTFNNTERWTNEERWFAEYIIFLGYSGVILRDSLNNIKTKNDFLSIWGFHDGDMFFLIQKNQEIKSLVAKPI